MTIKEFEYLCTAEAQYLIEQNIDRDPTSVALKLRNSTIATQIKNLQKCRHKLPSYYAARCIIPTISYEQSSSELAAFSKTEQGDTAVDLTCGLGVDSFALSKRFNRVTSVEIDPLRAEIARWNFSKLGIENVDVIYSSAEDYTETMPSVDFVYLDPSRRAESGKSVYSIEQCQPNVIELFPRLMEKSSNIQIKLSPLFDVNECYRLFGDMSYCQVVTVNKECKEVVVGVSSETHPDLTLLVIKDGVTIQFPFSKNQITDINSEIDITPLFLCVPDIGFYKSRTVSALMNGQRHYYSGGYVITEEIPTNFCGRIYEIIEHLPYQPKLLRKRFKQAIIHIRNFPYSFEQIGIKQGGVCPLFFTLFHGKPTVFIVK